MSHKTVELETRTSSANVSSTTSTTTNDENRQKDSLIDSTNSKSTDEVDKSIKQAKFRQEFALLLNPNPQTDKV